MPPCEDGRDAAAPALHGAGGRPARVVLVGAGWVARQCYLPALRAVGAEVAAVVDVDEAAARELARETGAATATSRLGTALAGDADLVIVATPNHTHVPLALRALDAGHRVLCEKPLATRRAAAERVAAAGGERLLVSCPYRYRRDVAALDRRVTAGDLGRVRRVRVSWTRARGIPRPGSWYTDRRLSGGGVLADLGPHLLDLALRWLAPSPLVRVDGWLGRLAPSVRDHASSWMPARPGDRPAADLDVEDQATLMAVFDDASVLELHAAWAGRQNHDRTCLEVVGEQGRAVLHTLLGYSTAAPPAAPRLEWFNGTGSAVVEMPVERRPERDFGRLLAACLGAGGPAPATGAEAVRVAELIEGAYAAATSR